MSGISLTYTLIARKLDKALRVLTPLEKPGRIEKLLKRPTGMDGLYDLVEDIRAAVVGYQVRPQSSRTCCT